MGPQLFIGSLDVTKSWEYADSTWGVPTAWTQSRKQGFSKEESLAVKGWHLNYAWKRVRKRPSVGGKGLKIPMQKTLSVCTAAARGGSTALSREFGQILLQQVGNFAWEIWSPWMQWCCQVSEKVSLASSVGLPRRGRREGSPPRRECDENCSCP